MIQTIEPANSPKIKRKFDKMKPSQQELVIRTMRILNEWRH